LEHEWVLLVCGAARLQFEDDVEPIELTSGSFVFIPARRRHRVEWTADDEPTVWLAFFWKE
jgi:cupin 2 domain-containing protein